MQDYKAKTDNLKTSFLGQEVTGLLICTLPASNFALMCKVPQMDQADHVEQRPCALTRFGVSWYFSATV